MEEGRAAGMYCKSLHLLSTFFHLYLSFLIGFDAKTCDLEDFNADDLAATAKAVFLMATYGEGEPTDNAQKFMKWLRNETDSTPNTFLQNTQFVVFGLGNRQYEHFNRTGKLTNAALPSFGAIPVYQYGEGDDDGSLEEDFDKWKANLWSSLGGNAESSLAASHAGLTMDFKVDFLPSNKAPSQTRPVSTTTAVSSKVPASLKHFFTAPTAKVSVNRELQTHPLHTTSSDLLGSTRHIEIDLTGTGVSYMTADNLAVLPMNPAASVQLLANELKYDLNAIISFSTIDGKENDFKQVYPTPCTVLELLLCYVDFCGPVRHSSLKHLLQFIPDETQKTWLSSLLATDKRKEFKEEIEDAHHSLLSLLLGPLDSVRETLSLDVLLHIAPPIQPRYYTISSSSTVFPSSVHITVSVTQYAISSPNHSAKHIQQQTQAKERVFTGLCSGYLRDLEVGQNVRIFVRASSFRLPKVLQAPVIMIGPGTGFAPMRALLQEREYLLGKSKTKKNGAANGECHVFFGCKHQAVDYIYRDEIERWQAGDVLTTLHTAFSRDDPTRKVYVQHLMTEQLVDLLINQSGSLFVCGATQMGMDVMSRMIELLQSNQKVSNQEATLTVKKLQEKGRYVQELWTA